ncbi:Non-repetitive/WGA-negative nucleoporin C-terminal-domain-containing protein [Cercophora newfieldiana]|uniref:Non-repetitive/WGA-negative nucleoporin C-terminal-domain-containing protein n=1 Tax=Cercophora newfieldiana TaxID=92897 RepID=A0AA39Y1X3_9PEZI|nr:Non-repetitive/WGA-negative nucleoporin C-terminal-domain-containing protein [Cercophora newfieldiana]
MFSPALHEGPAKGTRSSRRRARPLSSDASIQQPKAKRQRVPLSETTFVNPDAAPEMYEVKPDKLDLHNIKRDGIEAISAPRKELSVRSKKPKPGERASKGDGSVVLTQNNAYTVSKLPALPDRLRADHQNRQHGAVYSSSGYALEVTHTHAYVWPYTSTSASPETFTFALPYPSKHASDPLPLGSLVSPTSSTEEPGLVVVMPLSGKIVYWESISSAATLDFLRQQRGGVEDAVSGMFSGEHIVQIVNADSVGFVLAFSSGRLAYMNVRDIHGRPGISVQFLRSGLSNNASGFFGSLRHALSSSALRGDIAAARASQGTKIGERVVVAATSKGRLSCWKVYRGGRHELLADDDVREKVVKTIQQTYPDAEGSSQDAFEVVDFTFVPRGLDKKHVDMSRLSQALSHEQDELQHLLLLVAFGGRRHSRYVLVEVVISAKDVDVGMIRPLTSYSTPIRQTAAAKPRIYLPRPGLVAYVVFDRAVVVASMASPPDSPDSQLQEDSHIIPATFEDVIDFQDEGSVQVVGSGIEEPAGNGQDDLRGQRHRTKNPTVVLLLQGIGAIRVAVTDVDRFGSERPPAVTPKSKLEQAVFFGTKNDNPLVFQGRRSLPFTPTEIGNAAVELSNEIVSSKTPFIVNLPASLENNMRTRGEYLERLIKYLNDTGVALDSRTRWMLLYNAEKMHVTTWIWQKHEQFLAERPDGEKRTIISEIAVYINEEQKTEINPAVGEVDPVRHWFLNDVWRVDIFVAWAYQIIKYAWKERQTDEQGLNRIVWEAVTINNGALSEAYDYRRNNSNVYGVDPKRLDSSNGAREPWTSAHFITNNLKRLVEFCYQWLNMYYLPVLEDPPLDLKLVEAVRDALPSLTNCYFAALKEYSEWAAHMENSEVQQVGKTYRQYYENDRYEKILTLKDYGLWDEAIVLAKEHSAFEALAEIVVQQVLALEQEVEDTVTPSPEAAALLDAKRRQMGRLFDQYETQFAYPAYEVLLKNGGVQSVLEFPYDKNGFATSFLRTKPELAKISWINDVEREKDIDHAAETLLGLGLNREQHVWNKKIELSLGKLALLAEEAEPSVNGDGIANGYPESETRNGASLETIDSELAMIKIQDGLYNQMLPTFEDGVDDAARLELAMNEHGANIDKRRKTLQTVFQTALEQLLKHEALRPWTLIDLLTLAKLPLTHYDAIGDQFFLALKVAKHGLKGEDRTNAERLIWRRCLLRDNWKLVNETNDKNDMDQLTIIGETAAYRTMFAIEEGRQYDAGFRPYVKPSDVLGVFTEKLDRRFDSQDEGFQHKLLEIMRTDDKQLKAYIDKSQLDAWYRTARDEAEKTVAHALHAMTEASEKAVEETKKFTNGNGTAKPLFTIRRDSEHRSDLFRA